MSTRISSSKLPKASARFASLRGKRYSSMASRGKGLLRRTWGPLRDRRGSVTRSEDAIAFQSRAHRRAVFNLIQPAARLSRLQRAVPIRAALLGLWLGIVPAAIVGA